MRWMRRGMRQGIVVLGLIVCLAGCPGDDDEEGSTSDPTSTPPTTTTPTPTTPSSGQQFQSVVIESATNVPDPVLGCRLQVRVRNTTSRIVSVNLMYNAFDSTGMGFALTQVGGILPASSTQTFEQIWATPAAGIVECARIALF